MPTYDYHCTACGHRWELQQSIKAEPEHTCPKCRKRTASRSIGMGMAILMGGSGATPPATPCGSNCACHGGGAAASTGGKGASSAASRLGDTAGESGSSTAGDPGYKSKATHPAREGRGFGNIRDAIQRQRRSQEQPGAAGKSRHSAGRGTGTTKRSQGRGGRGR